VRDVAQRDVDRHGWGDREGVAYPPGP
jgi:hypothetical protein